MNLNGLTCFVSYEHKTTTGNAQAKFMDSQSHYFMYSDRNISDWIVEYLWLNSLEYEQVFWTIKKTQFLLMGLSFVLGMAYLIPNAEMLANRLMKLNVSKSPLARLNLDKLTPKAFKCFF